jgi:hypothetical protein
LFHAKYRKGEGTFPREVGPFPYCRRASPNSETLLLNECIVLKSTVEV